MKHKYKIILITGGARSGKSSFAEYLSKSLTKDYDIRKKTAYIATAEIIDKEMEERVEKHRKQRGDYFASYEESFQIDQLISKIEDKYDIFLIECVSTWLGNLFHKFKSSEVESESWKILDNLFSSFSPEDKEIDKKEYYNSLSIKKKLNYQKGTEKIIIIISNELGCGIVPNDEMSRHYRDLHGFINQKIARQAEIVYTVISGVPLRIK